MTDMQHARLRELISSYMKRCWDARIFGMAMELGAEPLHNGLSSISGQGQRVVPDAFLAPFTEHAASLRALVSDRLAQANAYASAAWDDPIWAQNYDEPEELPEELLLANLAVHCPGGLEMVPLVVSALGCTLLVTHDGLAGQAQANELAQSFAFRVLAASPPGSVKQHTIDASGLGQNLGILSRLPASLAAPPALASEAFSGELSAVEDHVAKLNTQVLLGSGDTLADRWRKGSLVGLSCHVVTLAGLPDGLREAEWASVVRLCRSASRAGVSVALVWDRSRPVRQSIVLDDLAGLADGFTHLHVAAPSAGARGGPGIRVQWVNAPGRLSQHSHVQPLGSPGLEQHLFVSTKVGPAADEGAKRALRLLDLLDLSGRWQWTSETRLEALVGRRENGDPVTLSIGDDEESSIGMVLVGASGSGKTTMLHSLIHSLAYRYSPDELELYLLDMKDGVEFAEYGPRDDRPVLPHVRVLAIQADNQFALGVLRRLLEMNRSRTALFTETAAATRQEVKNISDYVAVTGNPLPRVLLIADEFQKMLTGPTEDEAWKALEQLATQGRSQGIHILLATQTLGAVGQGRLSQKTTLLAQLGLKVGLRVDVDEQQRLLNRTVSRAANLDRKGAGVASSSMSATADVFFQTAILDGQERNKMRSLIDDGRQYPIDVSEGSGVEAQRILENLTSVPNLLIFGTEVYQPSRRLGLPLEASEGSGILFFSRNERAMLSTFSGLLLQAALNLARDVVLLDFVPENSSSRIHLDVALNQLGSRVRCYDLDSVAQLPSDLALRGRSCVVFVVGIQHANLPAFATVTPDLTKPAGVLSWLCGTGPSLGFHPIIGLDTPERLKVLGSDGTRLTMRVVSGYDALTSNTLLAQKVPFAAGDSRAWAADLQSFSAPILIDLPRAPHLSDFFAAGIRPEMLIDDDDETAEDTRAEDAIAVSYLGQPAPVEGDYFSATPGAL